MIDPLGLMPKATPCTAGGGPGGSNPNRFNPYGRGAGTDSPKPGNQRKYPESTYGDRNSERNRLDNKFGYKIDGTKTHQSEHAAGYDILSDNGGAKGKRTDKANKPLEDNAYAYYEDWANHRYHPGTGKGGAVHESGFTKGDVRAEPNTKPDDDLGYNDRLGSYRNAQRNAIEANDRSSAVQLNQLGYAHQQGFHNSETLKKYPDTDHSFSDKVYHGDDPNHVHHENHPLYDKERADQAKAEQNRRDAIDADPNHPDRAALDDERKRLRIADDSYHKMIDDMHNSGEGMRYNPKSGAAEPPGGHATPDGNVTTRPVDKWDAAEMHAGRDAARTGQWPGDEAYQRMYKDPTPEDWAALERGDIPDPDGNLKKLDDLKDIDMSDAAVKQRNDELKALHDERVEAMKNNRPDPHPMDVDVAPSQHSSDAMDTSD